MIVNFAAAMRRRSAFALCREYGMSATEIAPVLGLNEQQFLRALKRDGLSYGDMQQGNRQLRLAQRIMDLLRKELDTLSSLDEGSSGKVRLDALALLARTIERVSDLQERFGTTRAQTAGSLSADELRAVLKRIDERIDELADSRARELVQEELQRKGILGARTGVDLPGKDSATTAES
jgi:predicted transcriptional regulator